MQPSKWDLVLGTRPVPILEHLVAELAKLFAADLAAWPPAVESFDDATGEKVRALLKAHPLRPDARLYGEAFRLTGFDLSRQLDALDDYWRNQRWQQAGLVASDKAMLQFLSRFMAEQLLALGEATDGRINRSRMIDVLDRTRTAFFATTAP
ncbi:MAG: hypothetical protein AMXMBFR34_20460 [Myxococcaceae bacterium]